MKDYSNSSNFGNPDDKTFIEGSGKLLYSPKIKGITEIRCVGPVDANGVSIPQIDPNVDGLEGICDAFTQVSYAQYVGSKGMHFLVGEAPEGARKAVYPTFMEAITKYVDEHPQTAPNQWRGWLGLKSEGQAQAPRATLKKAKRCLFVQGYLYRNAGKPAKTRDGKVVPRENVVLAIPASASRGFLKSLQTPKDPTQALSVPNSICGDLVSPATGNVLVIEPYEHIFEDNRQPQTWYRCANSTLPGDRAEIFTPQVIPLTQEQNNACYTPWEDILNLNVPYATQISWLIETFSPEAVDYAFSAHPVYAEMVPPSCLGTFNALVNKAPAAVATTAPAYGAPAAPAPAAPAYAAPAATTEAVADAFAGQEVPADFSPAVPVTTVPPAAVPVTATPAVDPGALAPPVPTPAQAPAAAPAAPAMPAAAAPISQDPGEMLKRLNAEQAKL